MNVNINNLDLVLRQGNARESVFGNLHGNGVVFATLNVFFSGFAIAYAFSGVSVAEAGFAVVASAVLLYYAKESVNSRR